MIIQLPEIVLEEHNSAVKYYTGSIHTTKCSGAVEILGQVKNSNKRKFLIMFENGSQEVVSISALSTGFIKNLYEPIIYNVGFIGRGPHKTSFRGRHTKEYNIWMDMLRRCYDTSYHKRVSTYKDCTVDERWHNFQNFCEDIQFLEGYAEWKNNTTKRLWDLDKDIISKGNKIYSRETCKFVKHSENLKRDNKQQTITGLTYIGYNKEKNIKEEFTNQQIFSEKYMLRSGNINQCIKGHKKTHKGWVFAIKETIK